MSVQLITLLGFENMFLRVIKTSTKWINITSSITNGSVKNRTKRISYLKHIRANSTPSFEFRHTLKQEILFALFLVEPFVIELILITLCANFKQ